MTDNSRLIKELQSHTLVGGHSTCLEWETTNAIKALQAERDMWLTSCDSMNQAAERERDALEARVAELEAGLREITDACEADCGVPDADDEDDEAVGSGLEADGVTIRPMALTFGILRRARALLERNPS